MSPSPTEDSSRTSDRRVGLTARASSGPGPGIVDALADHLFTTFEGGFFLCRTLDDPGAMRGQLKVFRQLVGASLR